MIKLATDALRDALEDTFTGLKGIYNNWPGPEVKEQYPYMVVFMNRANVERMPYRLVKTLTDNSKLYSSGYFNIDLDVNYLARGGQIEDQAAVLDRMSDFFNINLSLSNLKETETSRDIPYEIQNYTATANVRLLNISLDQTGPDLQPGDRRSIFSLNMDAPRLKIENPTQWRSYKIDPVIS